MLKKMKRNSHSCGKSKMADSSDDERNVSSLRPFHGRKRDTGFKMGEIVQRAQLFKNEFNREDVHDRVLILQVMPDDYEMRELTARLELYERTNTAVPVNAVKSEVHEDSCKESTRERKLPISRFCADKHRKDKVEESMISLDSVVVKDDQLYGSETKEKSSSYVESSTPEICGTNGIETKISSAREFSRQSSTREVESSCDNESDSYCRNEIKSERSAISRSASCGEFHVREANKPSHYDLVGATDFTRNVEDKDIDQSEVYSSTLEQPIPLPRTFFLGTDHAGFQENEKGLNVYNCAIEDGSAKGELAFEYSEKTELEDVEYATGLDVQNENQGSMFDESESSGSASPCAVLSEHRIYVHASWLALNSTYFRSLLFESGMQESKSTEFCMKVAESDEDAFLLLLRSIYDPDILDTIEISQLMDVLRLSVKYDVRFSTIKAKRVLEVMPLTLDVCEAILEAVNSGGLPDLGRVMNNVEVRLLSEFEPLDETWESEKFATLSEPALRFVLGSDRLIVQSENTVFIALMQWIAKNAEVYENIREYSSLINLVRFELMKPTYINDVVREHEIAKQLEDFDKVYVKAITYHAMPPKRQKGINERQWCPPKSPTFIWILYPQPEMFVFVDENSINSTQSSSFWYFGYKMHLRLDLSACQDESCLRLVVENLVEDGAVELVYDVDVKFGVGLHKSFTCDRFVYQGSYPSSPPGNYPFDEKYSLGEVKEILLGSSVTVPITFEITLEKMLND